MNPRTLLALTLAGTLALALAAWAIVAGGEEEPPAAPAGEFAGARIAPGVRAPAFSLSDERGEPIAMSDFRGRPAVVTFLYTNCEETCPPAAQQVKGALNELGTDLPALAISVDPPNDTPASARAFLSEARLLGRMRFVLGSREQLEPLWRGYAIRPQSSESEHQGRIVLVDGRGFQRVGYPVAEATPERLAHDLRLLAAE